MLSVVTMASSSIISVIGVKVSLGLASFGVIETGRVGNNGSPVLEVLSPLYGSLSIRFGLFILDQHFHSFQSLPSTIYLYLSLLN